MKSYIASLKSHPGLLPATLLMFFGLIGDGLVGMEIMSLFWIPVFVTAWTHRQVKK